MRVSRFLLSTLKEAPSEAELVSVVAHLVNSGRVRLMGNFRGARIE